VQFEAEKMSKSLGNVALARDVLARYPGEVVRYWAITGSYRAQLAFSDAALEDARQAYERLRTFLAAARHALGDVTPQWPEPPRRPVDGGDASDAFVRRFIAAMDDDLNSAGALAAIHDLVREANRCIEGAQRGDTGDAATLRALTETFLELTGVLGFRFTPAESASALVAGLVEYLLELREQARREKAFTRADAIRARLATLGIAVEDTPSGARWRLPSS
jgi:cysteinyl-tRNA synthetase